MRPSPGSRRRSSTSAASTTCCTPSRGVRIALQRPRHRLPRAPRLRAPRRGALGRRAADGAIAMSAPPASCSRVDTESGFDGAVFITARTASARRWCRAPSTPTSSTCTSPRSRRGGPRSSGAASARRPSRCATPAATESVARGVRRRRAARRRRFSITDAEVEELARHALAIEEHYGRPMDIEWGDGVDGQAVHRAGSARDGRRPRDGTLRRFVRRARRRARHRPRDRREDRRRPVRVHDVIEQMHQFQAGDVLVADMTDPDWEPIMKRASAIVTDRGGRTCHAAIIARELGIPAVVGTGTGPRRSPTAPGSPSRAPKATTASSTAGMLDFEDRDPAGPHARGPGRDHDERRHARPGVQLRRAAERRCGPRAAGVHHQPADRHPPAALLELDDASRAAASPRSRERIARLRRHRGSSSSQRVVEGVRRSPPRSRRSPSSCA